MQPLLCSLQLLTPSILLTKNPYIAARYRLCLLPNPKRTATPARSGTLSRRVASGRSSFAGVLRGSAVALRLKNFGLMRGVKRSGRVHG